MNSYTLRNFRIFDGTGGKISLTPLTILTGCNSSGKSSFTKSIKLLQPMLQHLSKDLKRGIFRCFKDYYLNFAFGQHKLGSFEKTINWLSNKDEFSAEYSTDIMALSGRSVRVAFSFFPLFEAPETSIDQSSWQVRQIERNFVDNPHRLNRNRQAIYAGIRRLVITDELSDEVIFDYH